MSLNIISRWANENQGVLALLALIIAFPTLVIVVVHGARKLWPSRHQKQLRLTTEFAHATKLKHDVEAHAQWESMLGHYGEFLIRDAGGKLPETEETHSSVQTPHCIAVLTKIHAEHLEFILGVPGVKFIQDIGGSWHFAKESDENAIRVETVLWLNYREIMFIRWETDDYWEWPQICCRFTSKNKFPFSKIYYAEECSGLPRPYFRAICLCNEVFKRPTVCS